MWAKRKCYREGLFFFSYGRFFRRTATPDRDSQGRMSSLSTPCLFSPARGEPGAACSPNLGRLRRQILSWSAEKISELLKNIHLLKPCCLFPNQNRALLKRSVRLRHSGCNCSLYNSCKLYLLKMCSFSHLWQTPTAEHHS